MPGGDGDQPDLVPVVLRGRQVALVVADDLADVAAEVAGVEGTANAGTKMKCKRLRDTRRVRDCVSERITTENLIKNGLTVVMYIRLLWRPANHDKTLCSHYIIYRGSRNSEISDLAAPS